MVRLRGWETLKAVAGLAVGLGFNRNVIDCYEAILQRYEPGDRIFLFGFSRGGYTARAVANVLNLCGVPTTDGHGGPAPKTGRALRKIAKEAVVKVYGHGAGKPRDRYEAEREAIAHGFRLKYGAGTHPSHADVVPAFIGVFDSVAALGMTHPERVKVLVILGAAVGVATFWLGQEHVAPARYLLQLLVKCQTRACLESRPRGVSRQTVSIRFPMEARFLSLRPSVLTEMGIKLAPRFFLRYS